LAAYAFDCANLLLRNKNIIIFPRKGRKERSKKDMPIQQPCSGGCQGFLEKNTARSVAQVWRFFFKNPQGLTFTAGKRNGYLCILLFFG
jgi:hypothetical protein